MRKERLATSVFFIKVHCFAAEIAKRKRMMYALGVEDRAKLGECSGAHHLDGADPLLDRIDIHIEVPAVPFEELSSAQNGTSSKVVGSLRDQNADTIE